MAAGDSTLGVDRVTPKQAGGLRIVFSKNAANEVDVPMSTLGNNDYITKKMFLDNASGLPAAQKAFTSATGLTINWQTDSPDGYAATYAVLFGNTFPKPFIYVVTGTHQNTQLTSFSLVITDDGSGNLTTVVFDWGSSETGTIQF